MAHRLIIRPEAEADIADAAVWYDDQQSGLGNEFIEQVQVSSIAPPQTRMPSRAFAAVPMCGEF